MTAIRQIPQGPRLPMVGITTDGRRFEDWVRYRITNDILTPANTFSMETGPMPLQLKQAILPGHRTEVYFGDGSPDGDTQIITGWLERFSDEAVKQANMTATSSIAGRDKASDLIENQVPQGFVVKDRSLYDAATELCEPFGIAVLATNEANRLAAVDKKKYKNLMAIYDASVFTYNAEWVKVQEAHKDDDTWNAKKNRKELAAKGFPKPLRPPSVTGIFRSLKEANPQDGETIWNFISRYCGKLETHMWMGTDGSLILQRPQYEQDPSYLFIESERDPTLNNVRRRLINIEVGGMPTKITRTGRVKAPDGGKKVAIESVVESDRLRYTNPTTYDLGSYLSVAADFVRERWALDGKARNLQELFSRNWFAMRGMETGFWTVELELDGHDQGGRAYVPDTVCRYMSDTLGIDGLFYISDVTYEMDSKGANTRGQTSTARLSLLHSWVPEVDA